MNYEIIIIRLLRDIETHNRQRLLQYQILQISMGKSFSSSIFKDIVLGG